MGSKPVWEKVEPVLYEGHSLPTVPVYWDIFVLDDNTRIPYSSRMTFGKHLTPKGAAKECYDLPVTANMVFFNLSSSIVTARKMLREVRAAWAKMGGK